MQYGPVNLGHPTMWTGNNSIVDGGPAIGIPTGGLGLTQLGVTNSSPQSICVNSGPIDQSYAQLCLGFSTGIPQITLGGTPSPTALQFLVNGVTYDIPGSNCSGCGSMASQNANNVSISGGTIAGVSLSGATISGGSISGASFSNLTALSATVPTLSALKALPAGDFSVVYRQGFYAAGDGGAATYTWSSTPCSLSSGAGDNGSQVAPNSGTGCWLAQVQKYNPKIFGAKGNGYTDDTTAVQASFNASANNELDLGGNVYAISGVTCNAPISLQGTQGNQTAGSGYNAGSGTVSGFRPTAINQTMITVQSGCGGSIFQKFGLDMGQTYNGSTYTSIINTLGGGIVFAAPQNNITFTDVAMDAPCIGLDMSGTQIFVQRMQITRVNGSACGGIRVGHLTTGSSSTDDNITGSTMQCAPRAGGSNGGFGLKLEDAGGFSGQGNQSILCNKGTWLLAGGAGLTGQAIVWTKLGSGYYGDTGVNALVIDTANSSATLTGVTAVDGWAASSSGDNVTINNTGGSTDIGGFHFIGLQDYSGSANGMSIGQNVGTVTVDNSYFCGNGSTSSNVVLNYSITGAAFRNNHLGGLCDFVGNAMAAGITLIPTQSSVTQTYQITVTGNNFAGAALPINGASPSLDSVVGNNELLDTQGLTIASASSVVLNYGYSNYYISGSTSIATLTPFWNYRKVTLFPVGSASLSFTSGGNLCNLITPGTGVPVEAIYNAAASCWALK